MLSILRSAKAQQQKHKRVLFNHPMFSIQEGWIVEESGEYIKISWLYTTMTNMREWFNRSVIIKEL